MRDANIKHFKPQAGKPYFGHVSSAPDGTGVGFVLVHIENGRAQCHGIDTIPDDNYDGDVLCMKSGAFMESVPVQYFRVDVLRPDRAREPVASTTTDKLGRHAIWLEPGLYEYHYLSPSGAPFAINNGAPRQRIEVRAGRRVEWESENAAPRSENDIVVSASRELGLIEEVLICDWNTTDGREFSWPDIEDTIAKIAQMILDAGGELRFITFDPSFIRPNLLTSLQSRGLPAYESTLNDVQLAIAYRNFNGLAASNCLTVFNHERANLQLQRFTRLVKGSAAIARLVTRPGEYKYLADARVQAVHYASEASAMEQPQGGELQSLQSVEPGVIPLSGDMAVQQFMTAFLQPAPSTRVLRQPRYTLLGAGDKQG